MDQFTIFSKLNNEKQIKAYLKNNLDYNINFQNEEGETLLHLATEYGNSSIIKLLLKLGSNVNILNNKIKTPIILAFMKKDVKIAKILINDKNTDIFVTTENELTLLHEAVNYNCDLSILRLLIKKGCDILQNDELGETPLSLAEISENEKIINFLKINLK